VIYRCIVGSAAYGLIHEGSDVDHRGFYLPPADVEWSLAGVPEQLESDQEEVYWEIGFGKFVRLALKANPNILECLYSPLVETCTPLAQELIAQRSIFLSQYVHRTYNAYVLSQFKKLERSRPGFFSWLWALRQAIASSWPSARRCSVKCTGSISIVFGTVRTVRITFP
jgi:predicted nucleotidyltransferase